MHVDRKVLALAAAGILAVGILIGVLARGKETAPATGPGAVVPGAPKAKASPEKEFALAFFRAHGLGRDYPAAWEMMGPTLQKDYGGTKEHYVGAFQKGKQFPEPRKLDMREWQVDGYHVYLISSDVTDPVVLELTEQEGRLVIIDFRYWKGERLP